MKVYLRYIIYFFLLCIGWVFLHLLFIVVDGLTDEISPADVIVVLGNKVEENGKPSPRLQSRLDEARMLYEKGIAKNIIVSGARGKEGFEEPSIMKKYLVEQGIEEKNIIEDSKGFTTFDTAKNTKKIIEEKNWKSVVVVSQYYHISRTKLAFHKAGIETVFSAHARIWEWRDLYSLLREFVGYYAYLISD